jgi:hypothetical protein
MLLADAGGATKLLAGLSDVPFAATRTRWTNDHPLYWSVKFQPLTPRTADGLFLQQQMQLIWPIF